MIMRYLQRQVGQPNAADGLAQVAAGHGSPRLRARRAGAASAGGRPRSSTAGRHAMTTVLRTGRARLATLAPPVEHHEGSSTSTADLAVNRDWLYNVQMCHAVRAFELLNMLKKASPRGLAGRRAARR